MSCEFDLGRWEREAEIRLEERERIITLIEGLNGIHGGSPYADALLELIEGDPA